ncbi:hypothetical protein [Nocardia sp. NPDC051570]|uniref:hypothetical protein n=1 Tax=Nocardia sp. NPDC051570 TaxID=3364324 RepID=UPI00379F86BB
MTDTPIIHENDVMISMRGVADSIGLPHTVNPVELVDRDMLIELRQGPAGPIGPDGASAWPWDWQGDIADQAALQALRLGAADVGKAWRVVSDNAIHYWTGVGFIPFAEAFGRPGATGATTRLVGAATTVPAGAAAAAEITGDAPRQQLRIVFPRGDIGDPGDPGQAGRIQDAADVLIDDQHRLAQDFVLAWDAARQKFVPRPSPKLGGPWAIGQGQFAGGAHLSDEKKLLATITIPAQPMDWRPVVGGWIQVRTEGSAGQSRCDVSVSIGNIDGERIGYGHGSASPIWGSVSICADYTNPVQPGSRTGVVAANQTATLYVAARRTLGTARYTVRTDDAQLIVYALPV